jgi:ribosomal protein S8
MMCFVQCLYALLNHITNASTTKTEICNQHRSYIQSSIAAVFSQTEQLQNRIYIVKFKNITHMRSVCAHSNTSTLCVQCEQYNHMHKPLAAEKNSV